MRAYAISKFTSSDKINLLHYLMFHGETSDRDCGRVLGDDLSHSLSLDRNASQVPDVFAPSISFVVSRRVKEKLNGLPNVEFAPVRFGRLFSFPCQAGDFSYFKREPFLRNPWEYGPERLFERMPNDPDLHARIGDYYEVIVPRLNDIKAKYRALKTCRFRFERTVDAEFDVELSSEMLRDYPIIWHFNSIVADDAYQRMITFLDRDYFEVQECEV